MGDQPKSSVTHSSLNPKTSNGTLKKNFKQTPFVVSVLKIQNYLFWIFRTLVSDFFDRVRGIDDDDNDSSLSVRRHTK